MKIYFAASIRGGRDDVKIYKQLIDFLKQDNQVLTEHIWDYSLSVAGQKQDDSYIRNRDIAWLKEADLVVAETSNPSLGVGYELGYAERLHKPVIILHNSKNSQLSAMINGTDYFKDIFEYSTVAEAIEILKRVLKL
ncbi:nucleoside 2-deoxyribosyltransferase [Companilactobacillus huachuanensis]|uniref:Putative 2'-deoxynucleoside 5'-phosphate N-hydrolase 1 n=1 Tax=Companilactobacillus huachuanensis TaxID=2559914 RepID=A0ABW1RNG1_9LACO|nr:nucleoside 2-deoxyribosyltransferase [Companilactobacillus huachuanensis]